MRQHVNPLSSFFQQALELPDINKLFENDKLPIHLDIGSARGKFLLELASIDTNWNYLGVEIRSPLVISAQKERDKLNLKNLYFLYCNANISLQNWLEKINYGQLKRVTIQFPDPWFKKRHYKRRVLQMPLLLLLAKSLSPGSELFIQSDILSVVQSMINVIDASNCFFSDPSDSNKFLKANPFPVSSERERYVLKIEKPVYRVLYFRNDQIPPEIQE
mgnify:CR=1 FL=1|tara:strand:- start:637 stop:1290 length:654 start_codon:yes stop_codon:yes gene_type:complete